MGTPAVVRPAPAWVVDLLAIHEQLPSRYPHILVSDGGAAGQYDILFAYPEAPIILPAGASAAECARFLSILDQAATQQGPVPPDVPDLPFCYGHFLYLSYELAGAFEPHLTLTPALDVPLAWLQAFAGALVRDRYTQRTYITGRTERVVNAILGDLEESTGGAALEPVVVESVSEGAPDEYIEGVRRVQDYIRAGDIFQGNLSRGYEARLAAGGSPAGLLRALQAHNPAPFSALAQLGETAIISASPERLVRVQNGQIATHPIAGTMPRDPDAQKDDRVRRALRAHPKEQAEHVMLVDLERNDLGRICAPGTVHVKKFMQVESYATVHHLVSEIEGTLLAHVLPSGILRSVFPGGSITGCPKVRCLEILAELEGTARGAYTGSLGYINERGGIDLNILIRSFVLRGQVLGWRAGAGIVADSDPVREWQETQAKAQGLLRALGL